MMMMMRRRRRRRRRRKKKKKKKKKRMTMLMVIMTDTSDHKSVQYKRRLCDLKMLRIRIIMKTLTSESIRTISSFSTGMYDKKSKHQ